MRIEFGTAESVELPTTPATASKKNGWLPVLVVLFLISYALMTMLIVEQGRTIDSQRTLIRELFRDSTELAAARKAQDARAQAAQSQALGTKNPSSQNQVSQAQPTHTPSSQVPSNQTPSTQVPAKRHPSSQASTQNRAQNEAAKPKAFQMPTKPASDLVDADRSLILI